MRKGGKNSWGGGGKAGEGGVTGKYEGKKKETGRKGGARRKVRKKSWRRRRKVGKNIRITKVFLMFFKDRNDIFRELALLVLFKE